MKSKIIKLTALLLCLVMCLAACADKQDVYKDTVSEESEHNSDSSESLEAESSEESESAESAENSEASVDGESSDEASVDAASEDSAEEESGGREDSTEEVSSDAVSEESADVEIPDETTESVVEAPDVSEAPAEPVESAAPAEPIESEAPVHVHEYVEGITVVAGCNNGGYTVYGCTCGDSYKDNVVEAYGHSFGEWATVTEPTTEAEGERRRSCTRCGKAEAEAIEKLVAQYVTPEDAEEICTLILELLNEERAKLGAPALSTAPIAHEMAMVRARELTVLFAHKRPDGRDSRWIYYDYKYNPSCEEYSTVNGEKVSTYMPEKSSEDIAGRGYRKSATSLSAADTPETIALAIVQQFKDSPGHWADLTNPEYTGVGIGTCLVPGEYNIGDVCVAILTMDKTYG